MSKQITAKIYSLMENLGLKEKHQIEKQSGKLQQEINRAGFRVFECLSDLGYFTWNVPIDAPYHKLDSITNTDQLKLSSYLDVHGMPDELVDFTTIQTPKPFLSLPPKERNNQFPHGKLEIVSLHVAARYRGINFDDVDFAFGGSTLHMLANCYVGNTAFLVTRVPGTKTIMVTSSLDYIVNLSSAGFQFEHLMTGKPMDDTSSNMCTSVEHLQLMNIGSHRVFFRADTDAILDGSPVEITSSMPHFWGSKKMFRMISTGSTKLCSGFKRHDQLYEVMVQSLEQVSGVAVLYKSHRELMERKILEGMMRMQSQMEGAGPGEVFMVSFYGDSLNLVPYRGRSVGILPPADVVLSLLSPTKA